MRRRAVPACKKQTAFLLRLADFCGAPQRVLAKTGALRQTQLPVSSAGRGRAPPRLNLPQAAARLRSPPPFIGSPAAAPPPPYGGSVPGTAPLSGRPAETVRQAGQVRLLCSLQIEGIVRGPEPLSRGAAAGRGLPLWAGGWVQMFPTIERQSVRYRLCREALRFQESDRAEA